ncbi:NUDIX hydrolase [Specibacter cremeus]|uniref:NUDIX hydrolase n=1 Tax=Specibacter cremeus TaxID=1629051 RepID=UPI000F77249E|nr:CoA pyrophosphatase [Specibacter cremeus]
MTPRDVTPADVPGAGREMARLAEPWRARLARWTRHCEDYADPQLRRAAVAIAVYPRRGSAHFLMIKRVSRGSNPGQWALPGGRMDAGETIVGTALRELAEETGLTAAGSNVLGLLDDFPASRGIVITPVVVLLDTEQRPRRQPAEVASLHPLPLAALTAPGVPRWQEQSDGGPLLQMPLRRDMVVHAPTGAILHQFAEVVLRGGSVRVAGLAEPSFTAH